MKPRTRKRILTTASLTVLGIAVATAILFMAKGAGLNPELDFGAGAYYYADIPDFDKYEPQSTSLATIASQLPLWGYILIFLGWGALMYWLWTKI